MELQWMLTIEAIKEMF